MASPYHRRFVSIALTAGLGVAAWHGCAWLRAHGPDARLVQELDWRRAQITRALAVNRSELGLKRLEGRCRGQAARRPALHRRRADRAGRGRRLRLRYRRNHRSHGHLHGRAHDPASRWVGSATAVTATPSVPRWSPSPAPDCARRPSGCPVRASPVRACSARTSRSARAGMGLSRCATCSSRGRTRRRCPPRTRPFSLTVVDAATRRAGAGAGRPVCIRRRPHAPAIE